MAQAFRWLLLSLLLFCSRAQNLLLRRTRGDHLNSSQAPTENWFRQKLDHFSNEKPQFWSQRYFINNNFYKPGGPVFLRISEACTAKPSVILGNSRLTVYAQRLGALLILLEHRFYGKSQPTGDLTTDSLRYLSSRQALADIANFRTEIATRMGLTRNKWVAFGGSYGGSLAVWSRMKYPNLFAAAVGSSAPLKAKANFYEYFELFQRILSTHNSECPKAMKEAFSSIVHMLIRPIHHSKLAADLKLCLPFKINSPKDTAYILMSVSTPVPLTVTSTQKFYKGEEVKTGIDILCDHMTDRSLGSPYDRYKSFLSFLLQQQNRPCFHSNYSNFVEYLSDTSLKLNVACGEFCSARQWYYQRCTEFGFFPTTDSNKQPFSGMPLRYYVLQCSDFFGPQFNRDFLIQSVNATNEHYGGLNIVGSKIIFPNGSNDPWHALGITKDISKDLPAVFIEGGEHCSDVVELQSSDSAKLIQAREKIFQILQRWLRQ